jgi:hypothetical protein
VGTGGLSGSRRSAPSPSRRSARWPHGSRSDRRHGRRADRPARRGAARSGRHAVAVGTESFRDPTAGTRIQHELHDLFAKSGNIAATAAGCLGKKRCKSEQNRQPA